MPARSAEILSAEMKGISEPPRHQGRRLFQRVLLVGTMNVYRRLKAQFQAETFTLEISQQCPEALRMIMFFDFDTVICETPPSFSADMFRLAVERTKPNLARRILFLVSMQTAPNTMAALRRIKAPMLWAPFETHVLFQTLRSMGEERTSW